MELGTLVPKNNVTPGNLNDNQHKTHQAKSHMHDTRDIGLRHIYINDAIKDQGKSVAHTNPITRMTELKSLIGGYKSCKTTRAGSLIIEVHNFEQVKTILSLEKLMGIPVKSNLATDIGTSKGYAHEPRVMDIPTEVLKELWSDYKVIRVDRKRIIKEGKETFNASLFITFKGDKVPRRLPIGDEWIQVQKWKTKVLQCAKYNSLYHLASKCTGTEACAECGKTHPGECKEEIKNCTNCKKAGHGAKDPECPILKRETEITKIRGTHKLDYAKAKSVPQ